MSKTFDQGKDEVAKLCQYFATNQQSFLAPGVKEAHVRQSLIDPFFEALGWDVRNDSMTAPQYREVIPEDSLEVEGQQKAPDYTFRVGTLPKFYVEAKKCGVNISADPAPAYQLRRYGFSAKLALSILTDFEELGVYDCASRPRPGDKASHGRIQYFRFTEYPDRWREIWDVFSREAVWSGKFDQYAASKRKRGISEVDTEFLKDIEGWRVKLARNLALRNKDLSVDDLNVAVQRIIDRIVFLRMAEDRGLESYGQLLKLCQQPNIYARFVKTLCRKADEKYNSGLFHFHKEPGVSDAPDTLTPRLAVDDNTLKLILQSLYFEHGSPYNFHVMPVEILGTVYERFLGKVIRLTAGHQAKVEEKPEVRKAGGVYYTPAYIVTYIVQNTIGKQIEGKSPAVLAGGKNSQPFRVLDMACGSGSFLLGAYQFLMEHCLKWYQSNPSPKHAKAVYQNLKGETCLTIAERKRILTTHIYGVDIDRQ
ncbi:MAG: type I restriction endonuclease, partial [Planctomycetota bacterium]